MTMPRRILPLTLVLLLASALPARADFTAFVGSSSTPSNRSLKGFALGVGLLMVGFEFEYSKTVEDPLASAPSLRTGMGNVLLQTPFPVMGLQPYFTTGGGVYREALGAAQETHFGLNSGGGVKVSLIGPLRARVDYRIFTLKGNPLHSTAHRLYAGVNLKF